MATWAEFVAASPELAAKVRERFDSGTNKTVATLRRDGSPRISGTELTFSDTEAHLDMMLGVKWHDLTHDPRFAVHSPTLEPPAEPTEWVGEAKMSGVVVPCDPPAEGAIPDAAYFTLDIREVVHTRVAPTGDKLVIESWHPDRGYELREH
jgi:hypothetical protein